MIDARRSTYEDIENAYREAKDLFPKNETIVPLLEFVRRCGVLYTLVDEHNGLLGVVGGVVHKPGVGVVYSLLTNRVYSQPLSFARFCVGLVRSVNHEAGLDRLECSVWPESQEAIRFAKLLGFKEEGKDKIGRIQFGRSV